MTNAQETNATVTAAYILIRRKLKLMEPIMIPVMGTVSGMRLILPALAYLILNDKKAQLIWAFLLGTYR